MLLFLWLKILTLQLHSDSKISICTLYIKNSQFNYIFITLILTVFLQLHIFMHKSCKDGKSITEFIVRFALPNHGLLDLD